MDKNNAGRTFTLSIDGSGEKFTCRQDQTLLQALTAAGFFLEASCGGRGTCGKCKVRVAGPVTGADGRPATPQAGGLYLACQTYPAGDITVQTVKAAASAKGLLTGEYADDGRPLLKKLAFSPDYPTLTDGRSLEDMLARALAPVTPVVGIEAMRQLAAAAQGKPARLTVALAAADIVGVEAGDTTGSLFGVAFDIGTTTVVGMLVDINHRRIVAHEVRTNPQGAFGADVVSRIDAATRAGALDAQAAAVRQCMNEIIGQLSAQAGIGRETIYAATIAGNATMEHLLLAISPASLSVPPYTAAFRHMPVLPAAAIELGINPAGRVILLPNIASFIGADTTAAVLATGQDTASAPSLLVDLGTNGEMVLATGGRLLACSTACGPAFEGACIRDGMRAAPGAIDDVTIEGDVAVRTIAGARPAGICGSGVVKAVAELIRKNIIIGSGRFNTAAAASLGPLAGRLRNKDGQWEFVLTWGADSATGADIAVTQNDIRQIQLVKSAICSGIEVLMEIAPPAAGLPVYLAGAFGNYLDIDSALTIGMLPGFSREQVVSVGNAAGVGAVQALLSAEKLARCRLIADRVEYVELAAHPDFQNKFLENLAFDEVM